MPYIDINVFIGLEKSLLKPLLKTSISILNSYMVKHIKRFEAVKRRAKKFVRGISHLSYNEKLPALKLSTHQYRGELLAT